MKVAKFVVMFLFAVIVSGCVQPAFQESRVQASRVKSNPSSYDQYTSIPFRKAINPAFKDDVANKMIRCKVRFMGQMEMVKDLPPQYRSGYVRIMVSDADRMTDITYNVIVPKNISDLAFELNHFDLVEIHAYVSPMPTYSAISGRGQDTVLFVVKKIEKIADAPAQPALPAGHPFLAPQQPAE